MDPAQSGNEYGNLGCPDQLQLALERRVSKRTPSRFRAQVLTSGVEPSLHFDYKKTRIQQYFRLPHVDVVGNGYDFALGLNWQGVIRDERTRTHAK